MVDSRFVVGDSSRSHELASDLVGSVALVVTSPPYHNAIDYEGHVIDPTGDYRRRADMHYADDYLTLMNQVWDSCYRMLRPGGYLVINAGTVLESGYHYPLPQDLLAEILAGNPWEFIRTILWNKVTAGVSRAGTLMNQPYPGYWSYNIMTEHIQVIRKPGSQSVLNFDVPAEWWEPVWDLAPVPPRSIEHPAPYPEDLPHRFIRMLTNENDWVMDPFNGAGATTKAAVDLKRRALGFDISDAYSQVAENRLHSHSSVRVSQLRIKPVAVSEFVPPRSARKESRHGVGIGARRPKNGAK